MTKDRAYFVATLMQAYKGGLWIELSVPAPELGSIGEWGGDGSFYNYENEQYGRGKEDLVAAHAAFVAWHEARFRRLYWLDAKGIQLHGEKGLESIDGAVVASKAAADGVTVEVELPLRALPRMSQAPADSFFLFATGGSAAVVPEVDPESRIEVMQKAAIAFEPLSDLRAHVAAIDMDGSKRLRFSYHPAKPTVVEFIHFQDRENGGTLMEATEQVLWEPITKLGAFDVGYVHMLDTYVGLFKGPKFVSMQPLSGEPKGFAIRKNALHIVSLENGSSLYGDEQGVRPWFWMDWHVTTVDSAGKFSEAIESRTGAAMQGSEVFNDKGFTEFGFRGIPSYNPESLDGEDPPGPAEIRWRFQEKSGAYVLTTKPLPKKKK